MSSFLSGCLSQVSTSIRETSGAPSQRLRLIHPDFLPIAGAFHQEGHAIIGQLTLPGACNAESHRQVKRQEVTERRTNQASAIGWLIAGTAVAAIGAGFMAASADANQQVTCGEGQARDRCESEASAMADGGLAILIPGLTMATIGAVFLARKPHRETKDLPARESSKLISESVACAPLSSLEGVVVAIELRGRGTWTGRANADGAVRIEVLEAIAMPEGAKVPVVVQSVPSTFAKSIKPGDVLAEVTFEKQPASSSLSKNRR